jgi:triosephosphate isomerase
MRKYLVAGNWKMNGSKQQIKSLLQDLMPKVSAIGDKVDLLVCPPSIYIDKVAQLISGSNLQVGAQNVARGVNTAFTGEISPAMLGDFSCNYVIIGHSERRQLLGETDEQIAAKCQVSLAEGLKPILCVGETQQQMNEGRGFAVVEQQLQTVLQQLGIEAFAFMVIAYEPVWAIGTGLTATPEQAQAMHAKIRGLLAGLSKEIAATTRVIYGGSVNSSNAKDLFKELDIDGGLIGGASLKAQDFSDICHAAMSMTQE